jgi:hypothetical protein
LSISNIACCIAEYHYIRQLYKIINRYIKKRNTQVIDEIFAISDDVRYVAIYRDGQLESKSKGNTQEASSSESDRYEELLVNPTLLKTASQRGNIDCGGLDYLLVRYGNFFQFVLPVSWGHVSVCIEKSADPITIGLKVMSLIENEADVA